VPFLDQRPANVRLVSLVVRRFDPDLDLATVLALCEAEGWPSLPADPERARRALTAPGVTTVVAVVADSVVEGFAQIMSDGEIQAFLVNLLVTPALRQQGVGRALIREAFGLAGGQRVDLLTDTAEDFYERWPHRRFTGFRLYPDHPSGREG